MTKKNSNCSQRFFLKHNLGIPQYTEGEPVSQIIDDSLMKAIKEKCVLSFSFSFSQVDHKRNKQP